MAASSAAQFSGGLGAAGMAAQQTQQFPPCLAPPSGLVGWWKGDGSPADSAGNQHGAAFGISYVSGVVGQAFNVNPYTGYVDVPDSPALHFANAMTVEAWVQPISSGARDIVSKCDVFAGRNQMAFNFYQDANGYADFAYGTPSLSAALMRS